MVVYCNTLQHIVVIHFIILKHMVFVTKHVYTPILCNCTCMHIYIYIQFYTILFYIYMYNVYSHCLCDLQLQGPGPSLRRLARSRHGDRSEHVRLCFGLRVSVTGAMGLRLS